jgi:hypothetical protein
MVASENGAPHLENNKNPARRAYKDQGDPVKAVLAMLF